jgi:plasmid stability protein
MKNITLAIDEQLLKKGREYAQSHGVSLNALIRDLLRQTVDSPRNWVDDTFAQMDKLEADSHGRRWRRNDLHRV